MPTRVQSLPGYVVLMAPLKLLPGKDPMRRLIQAALSLMESAATRISPPPPSRETYTLERGSSDPLTGTEPLEVGEALYALDRSPTKLLVIEPPHRIPTLEGELLEAFGERVHVTGSQTGFLEVVPRGVHKGRALRWLADALGVESSQVLALGDGDNDAEMLGAFPLGVAVSGGSPRARAAAAFTAPAEEDPVVWAVGRFVLGETP